MQAHPNISYGIVNTKQYHLYVRFDNHVLMESINLLTRKGASCTDLLTCLYNLKPSDLEVLLALAKNENATTRPNRKNCYKKIEVRCIAAFLSL